MSITCHVSKFEAGAPFHSFEKAKYSTQTRERNHLIFSATVPGFGRSMRAVSPEPLRAHMNNESSLRTTVMIRRNLPVAFI